MLGNTGLLKLSGNGSPSAVVAALAGQDLSVRTLTTTQTFPGNAIMLTNGTGIQFVSGGNLAYVSGNFSGTLGASIGFSTDAGSGAVGFGMIVAGARIKLSAAGSTDYLSSNGSTLITAAGSFAVASDLRLTSFTDDSATTGNRTVNSVRGFNAFAAAASAVTITNSFVTANSQILVTIMTNDATALLKNVVPAAGSFTVNLNANTTGITKFAWTVIN